MRILFVLDNVPKENENYSSVLMAHHMHCQGHDVFLTDVYNLAYYPDGQMGARAWKAKKKNYKTQQEYINEIKTEAKPNEVIKANELDVLFIRNDPSAAPANENWSQTAGVVFGQVAVEAGVIVLNDPFTLSDSVNKMYFQQFPEAVRPKTIITRDIQEIKDFYKDQGRIIIKPLQGSGGQGVFLVTEENKANINSMIEANLRDGYIIAQEYLPKAAEGDIRLFMVNGQIYEHKGKVAALHRYNDTGDARNNIHAGGKVKKVKITNQMRELAEWVRPKLIADGIFIAGLDIAGDKLMETNLFSPGALTTISRMEDVNFAEGICQAIERKVDHVRIYGRNKISNKELNVL